MSRIRRNWTAKEDKLLCAAVQKAEEESRPLLWRELAKSVPGRSNKDCRRRWWNSLANNHINKGPWSEEEDERLFTAVQTYGMNWSQVAAEVRSRNSDQCSSHWSQVLNPNINYCDWAEEEDANLLHEVLTHGTNWATIAGFHTPIRTTLALKNRYSTLRLRNENKKNRQGESDTIGRKRQSSGPNSVSSQSQTSQWELLNLTDPALFKPAAQSVGSKSTGSNNDDDEDDDDSEEDDCDDNEEDNAALNQSSGASDKGERPQRRQSASREPLSSNRPTLLKMPGSEMLETQVDNCMQFESLIESCYPSASTRPFRNEDPAPTSNQSQDSGPTHKDRTAIHLGEPKTDDLHFSPTGLMGSPITMDTKMTDSGFVNADCVMKDKPYSATTPLWLRQPDEHPVPFPCHFNVSITMACDQSQVQAIMTNLSHLGTNITLNFQRIA
ncbi:Myb family transcription factor [Colletotrichum higginsianum IMI 349063]|uniref:Myb family transcription factor n=1 Tax=Colletotrichum higginsianum (strain IMI 349063) TaxID=759273 RepID=A0A1B7XTR0_COLHI|nr:Myb family transcription factor [Colletotrichum higginsianum IMI 349063]OBR03138.1 Myb family transcription factor [Colletotrichum higginsianum IMI 349063]